MFFQDIKRFSQAILPTCNHRFFYALRTDGEAPLEKTIANNTLYTLTEAIQQLKKDGYLIYNQQELDAITANVHLQESALSTAEAANSYENSAEYLGNQENSNALPDENDTTPNHYEALLQQEKEKSYILSNQIDLLKSRQKKAELLKAIIPWAVDADLVLSMTQEQFDMDENGNVFPVNLGKESLKDSQDTTSTEQFYQKFQQEKPYLVKASSSQGAGSFSQEASNSNNYATTIEQLADMSIEQFIKLGGIKGKLH